MRPRWTGRGRDRGSTTAELAAATPALALLLFVGVAAVAATQTKLQCADAARDAALAAARGQEGGLSRTQTAPDGATITISINGDVVTATVRAPARVVGTRLPPIEVSATAVAAREPDDAGIPW
ncbi:TadE family type IV pilus minor pilin [Asanoa ishikariensis]|uniref:TadE family type IV pilus minor pilin n=1 Tax=Asanoa ishikariensis TaxID=137265 RepID=UPI000B82F4BD|nr:TadE family type IV pilus minor pilin [Asanoa ishikariensis]